MAKQAKSSSNAAKQNSKVGSSNESRFTQENFEKELKNLAAKAQEETWSKWAAEQFGSLLQAAALLILAAVYSNVSQLVLSPVYGSIPASVHHSKGVMASCFIGWSTNLLLKRNLPIKPAKLIPLIAAYIPFVQFFLFKVSGTFGATYGPVVIEALTFYPLLVLSVGCTATALENVEIRLPWKWMSDAAPGVGSFAFYKTGEFLFRKFIQSVVGSSIVYTRLGLQILLAGLYSVFAPSKLLLFALPALLHTALFNTHLQLPHTTSALNSTLASEGWTLLDRRESITGYLSVIESPFQKFRVLRCDHSLLGGQWISPPVKAKVEEPIYAVFVLLEAVRLIEYAVMVPDWEASALVIGLGIGTTPSALMAHGINTTVVEIDPAVHDFATKYFSLASQHTAVIRDAVAYASETAQTSKKFNYIIHDVFTGGAEPVDLFTLEFLQDLKSMLAPDGVIAINYAGDLLLPPARIIVHTIKTVFPSCRIFRETPRPSDEEIASKKTDFTNMVIFCTESGRQVVFREPTTRDLLGSQARKQFLMPRHEVKEADFFRDAQSKLEEPVDVLSRNDTERFRPWQEQGAASHWGIMRTVLPDSVWENW